MTNLQQTSGRTAADRGDQLLSVRVGAQEFAMTIMAIREIRGWIASTPLPHAPAYIKGMINLRGSVLAIIDLAVRLGLPSQEPTTASVVVVVETGETAVGLLVDAVSDIITITEDMRQLTPEIGDKVSRAYVESLFMVHDRIIGILSLDAVIPKDPMLDLALESVGA